MTTRREFLEIAAAAAAILPGGWSRALAQQRLRQDDITRFEPLVLGELGLFGGRMALAGEVEEGAPLFRRRGGDRKL